MKIELKDDTFCSICGGNTETLGKNTGSDVSKDKLTYVSYNGIEESEKLLEFLTEQAVESIALYYDNAEFFRNLVIELANRTN